MPLMEYQKPLVLTNAYRNKCDAIFQQIRNQMRDERCDKMHEQTVTKCLTKVRDQMKKKAHPWPRRLLCYDVENRVEDRKPDGRKDATWFSF